MNEAYGAEESYVRKIIGPQGPSVALIFRYGMLASEFGNILGDPNLSPSEQQALSGLIQRRQLLGLGSSQLTCLPQGTLTSVNPEYLRLGICCGQKFLHDLSISAADKATFGANNVLEQRHGAIDYVGLGNYQASNSIASWGLADNGTLKPSDIMLERTKRAANVTIYDRFLGTHALDALEELLTTLAVGGKIDAVWEVLIGTGTDGLSDVAIKTRLQVHFTNPNRLIVSYSGKPRGAKLHAHDRYVQIDEAYTFVLTAGLGSFYESAGKNRACSVELHDLYIGYTRLTVKRMSDGASRVIKF